MNDAEVQRFLQNAATGGAALLERRFRDGISAGEIPSDFPVAARAIQVTDLARGLTMRAQIGTPRKTLLKDAEEAADLVLLPRCVVCPASGTARVKRVDLLRPSGPICSFASRRLLRDRAIAPRRSQLCVR